MQPDEYLKLSAIEDRLWYFRSLHAQVARELDRHPLPPDARVLDAGCGTGGLILRLRPAHPARRWSGLDFSGLACDLARQRCGPSAEIVEASATAMPFADATFDAVVSADLLCQFDDPAPAVREFFRVLRPGGLAVINAPAYQWLWSYHDAATHGRRRFNRAELRALLHDAGFSVVRLTHTNAFLLPLAVAKRKLLPAPPPSSAGSDVHDLPALLDSAFAACAALERAWLRTGLNLPFGTSVLAVAQKPRSS